MSSSSLPPEKKSERSETAFGAWGCLAGTVLGTGIGLCTHHWVVWAIFVGVTGLVIGGLIDRSRR